MRKFVSLAVVTLVLGVVPFAAPAAADHTDPNTPLSNNVAGPLPAGIQTGAGTWVGIQNFPSNPGTDLKFFTKPVRNRNGTTRTDLFASSGTLGQGRGADVPPPSEVAADNDFVGQRITRLLRGANLNIQWRADHGSAHCSPGNLSVTGLQHDPAATGVPVMRNGVLVINNPKVLIDNTDANNRCHDNPAGGLEFIDISKLGNPKFKPREIHLTRHVGTSHTVTVDATRPWIVYNNSSSFDDHPWIDVLNIRSCLLPNSATLRQRRDQCRPKVYRIPYADPDGGFNNQESPWSQARDIYYDVLTEDSATCHDITATPGRLYCAALNATLIFDVRNLTDANGNIRGKPLPCKRIRAQPRPDAVPPTTAKVTDCATDPDGNSGNGNPFERKAPGGAMARGWRFLGTFNHPGRDCIHPHFVGGDTPEQRRSPNTSCNGNDYVHPSAGVSVAHEADPDPTGRFMAVTDERGGGVVPPGATCSPGVDNPVGNGGAHFFDIRNPSNIRYARMPGPANAPAVFIGSTPVPSATFCDIHVMEFIPGRQRFVAAYYNQGTKIVDYFVDSRGKVTFKEVAGFVPAGANSWTSQVFKIENLPNNRVRYSFMASDIQRGIDIFTWTGPQARRAQNLGRGGGGGGDGGGGGGGGDDNGGGGGDDNGDDDNGGGDDPNLAGNTALGGAAVVLLPAAAWFRRRRMHSRQ